MNTTIIPVWKTITLGNLTVAELRKALQNKKGGIGLAPVALQTLDASTIVPKVEADLVAVTYEELGLPDGATREAIYAKAIELGLQLCPPEVGPLVWLEYYGQQKDCENLIIGMEPVSDNLFYLYSTGSTLVFTTSQGALEHFRGNDSNSRWVFIQPRK